MFVWYLYSAHKSVLKIWPPEKLLRYTVVWVSFNCLIILKISWSKLRLYYEVFFFSIRFLCCAMNLFCLNRFFLFATRMFIVRYSLIIKSDKKIHTLMVRRGKRTQWNEKIGANRLASILYVYVNRSRDNGSYCKWTVDTKSLFWSDFVKIMRFPVDNEKRLRRVPIFSDT